MLLHIYYHYYCTTYYHPLSIDLTVGVRTLNYSIIYICTFGLKKKWACGGGSGGAYLFEFPISSSMARDQ